MEINTEKLIGNLKSLPPEPLPYYELLTMALWPPETKDIDFSKFTLADIEFALNCYHEYVPMEADWDGSNHDNPLCTIVSTFHLREILLNHKANVEEFCL